MLGHALQDVAEQQYHGVVAHQHHAVAAAQRVQFAEHGPQPQRDVRPGFPARRPVVELAQPPPSFCFFGQPVLHAEAGEHVQNAQFAVAEPLVGADGHRPARRLDGDFGSLVGAHIGGGNHDVGTQLFGDIRQCAAQGLDLFPACGGQLDVGVAGGDVDHVRAGLLGGRGGHIALALAVPDQDEFHRARSPACGHRSVIDCPVIDCPIIDGFAVDCSLIAHDFHSQLPSACESSTLLAPYPPGQQNNSSGPTRWWRPLIGLGWEASAIAAKTLKEGAWTPNNPAPNSSEST